MFAYLMYYITEEMKMNKNLDASILDEEFLTISEVAEKCRLTPQTIQREIDEGKLIANKLRGSWRILKSDFIEYLRETRTKKQNRPIRQARP